MNDRNIRVEQIICLFLRLRKSNHKRGLTNPQLDRRRRTRWCRRRATSSPCEEGRTPVSSCLPSVDPAAWWSGPWARGSIPFCDGGGWGSTLRFAGNIPGRQTDWVIQWKCAHIKKYGEFEHNFQSLTLAWSLTIKQLHSLQMQIFTDARIRDVEGHTHLRSDPTPVVGVRSLRV